MTQEVGIGFYMKKINDYIHADANERLKKLDLTYSQMHILIYILRCGGSSVRQKDILHYFNISHPTVVGLLKRMEPVSYTHLIGLILPYIAKREKQKNRSDA